MQVQFTDSNFKVESDSKVSALSLVGFDRRFDRSLLTVAVKLMRTLFIHVLVHVGD